MMNQPSCEEILQFLKSSDPHKDILHALPIRIVQDINQCLYSNSSMFYKQYALLDLERWGLIELQQNSEYFDDYRNRLVMRLEWRITLIGEQYLADVDYVGN